MATYVMQSLGCEVAALNTVQFSEWGKNEKVYEAEEGKAII
jgi:pyridoxal/pyridoxine/pyridoxamine kinase